MMRNRTQRGVGLVEVMVSLTVGAILMSSMLTLYVSTVNSSADTLEASKLNQELSALMNVMANDIRRAGYWGNMAPADYEVPQTNPFAQIDETALEVHAANVQQGETGSGECIVYTYDANRDGVVDDADIRGFRLNGDVVQMRERGDTAANAAHDSCNDAEDIWRDVTDGNVISITNLTFDLADSVCLNTAEPDGEEDGGDPAVIDDAAESDCYDVVPGGGSGDITVETRQIRITVTGELVSDPTVSRTRSQDVRVRNDLVRVR